MIDEPLAQTAPHADPLTIDGQPRCCPTCGRPYRRAVPTPQTREERRAACRAAMQQRVAARTARDQAQILPRLPAVFTGSDVGRACQAVGRPWGEQEGVLHRFEKAGLITMIEPARHGFRLIRRWRTVPEEARS